ncbi:MAG: DUF366 family protein [Candidatus Krumholzibacteria bacterium]|nr:DUF366 family protein [Candidatus Krumholzibacteria bacterium]
MLAYKVLEVETPYTGKELRSGWVLEQTGLRGDAAAAFLGPCRVVNEDLVDLDDARAGTYIESAAMAHVLIEHPQCRLDTGVLRQRMLVCLLCEILGERNLGVRRQGDDIYFDSRKLTVSIAAPSSRSTVIHLGINIRPEGAPVPAVGLDEMKIDARELLTDLLGRYGEELESCRHAQTKVRTIP